MHESTCNILGTTELRCAYRGDGGSKCAVGHILPDEVYNEVFEGEGVGWVITDLKRASKPETVAVYERLSKHLTLFRTLQSWHDNVLEIDASFKTPKECLGKLAHRLREALKEPPEVHCAEWYEEQEL